MRQYKLWVAILAMVGVLSLLLAASSGLSTAVLALVLAAVIAGSARLIANGAVRWRSRARGKGKASP